MFCAKKECETCVSSSGGEHGEKLNADTDQNSGGNFAGNVWSPKVAGWNGGCGFPLASRNSPHVAKGQRKGPQQKWGTPTQISEIPIESRSSVQRAELPTKLARSLPFRKVCRTVMEQAYFTVPTGGELFVFSVRFHCSPARCGQLVGRRG